MDIDLEKFFDNVRQGYTFAVVLDLSKYFDTLNHEILINLLRKNVKDERVESYSTVKVLYGNEITAKAAPSKKHHIFTGWKIKGTDEIIQPGEAKEVTGDILHRLLRKIQSIL